jgi:hypothetical protein
LWKPSCSSNANVPCIAAGRIRYSQLRRFWWRGAVNAVPLICSAYSPCATTLRRVAPLRQRAGDRLAGELVAEAGLVAVAFDGHACRTPVALTQPLSRTRDRGSNRSQHAALHLVALDALEQRLEVAFAEAFVALALDDLEEDRAERVLGEDLQQLALLGFRDRRRSGSCWRAGAARLRRGSGMRWSITSK